MKRFLQPYGTALLQYPKPQTGCLDVVFPNRSCVHQQQQVLAQTFPRRPHVLGIGLRSPAPEGSPAELGRAQPALGGMDCTPVSLLGIIAEELGCISCFGQSL